MGIIIYFIDYNLLFLMGEIKGIFLLQIFSFLWEIKKIYIVDN